MKSINEQLFERIMRLPHDMRSHVAEEAVRDGGRMHGRPPIGDEGRFSGRPPFGPHGPARPMPMPHRPGMEESCPRVMPFRGQEGPGDAPRPLPFPGGAPTDLGGHGGKLPGRAPGMRPGPNGMLNRERVLEILNAGAEDGMRQKDIAEQMRVNPSTMSEFIALLETNGYVTRKVDPNDRRATVIALTDLGKARACELADEKEARFAKLFSNLTDEEKGRLIELIDKLFPAKPQPARGTHLV